MKTIDFHPAARRELLRAVNWYRLRSEWAAATFDREINHAIERIAEAPEQFPIVRDSYRRFVLSTCPFSVVYEDCGQGIRIVAVAHDKRRPGYWRRR